MNQPIVITYDSKRHQAKTNFHEILSLLQFDSWHMPHTTNPVDSLPCRHPYIIKTTCYIIRMLRLTLNQFYSRQFSDTQTNNYLNVVLFSCVLPKHSQSTRCTTAEQSNVLSKTKVKSLYIVTVHTNPTTIAKSTCQNGCKKMKLVYQNIWVHCRN